MMTAIPDPKDAYPVLAAAYEHVLRHFTEPDAKLESRQLLESLRSEQPEIDEGLWPIAISGLMRDRYLEYRLGNLSLTDSGWAARKRLN